MACRTSLIEKGFNLPSGAGAGFRINEIVLAGAS